MFGYITINPEALSETMRGRYQAYYCGLCKTLKERHGNMGRATLSYDMTFLLVLLSSLYEPEEAQETGRCIVHPIKEQTYIRNELAEYVADMNIILAYHKAMDDWADDRSKSGLAQAKLLEGAYRRIEEQYPEKSVRISKCLQDISRVEQQGDSQVDLAVNLTAHMLGEIFAYREDLWNAPLRKMGEELGRFIYLMDAYEDLPGDMEKQRYNPLIPLRERSDFEALCREGLLMMMGECGQAFDVLPLEKDVEILENVLYGGVWRKYVEIFDKREQEAPVA